MTRNTSDALPFVRERLGAGQRLTAPDKLGWNRKTRRNRKPTELQPEVKEKPKTDGVTAVGLSDRAETRDGVLERAAKDDSSTR